jgi:uncharacterized membrane protein
MEHIHKKYLTLAAAAALAALSFTPWAVVPHAEAAHRLADFNLFNLWNVVFGPSLPGFFKPAAGGLLVFMLASFVLLALSFYKPWERRRARLAYYGFALHAFVSASFFVAVWVVNKTVDISSAGVAGFINLTPFAYIVPVFAILSIAFCIEHGEKAEITLRPAFTRTQKLTAMGLFAGIIFLLMLTPIGFIQLPFIKATVVHVPVIIGAVILGPKYGASLGFMFGLASLISNTTAPVISSFVFTPLLPVYGTESGSPWALAVCFVPRILVGVVPYYVYVSAQWLSVRLFPQRVAILPLVLAGVSGALTNTLLVMHLIYFLFRDAYADARGIAYDAVYTVVLSIIFTNGVFEAILAGVLVAAVCAALLSALGRTRAVKV